MDKEQKAEVVKEVAARLGDAEAIFAVDYRGISVPQAAELRTRLRDADATFAIVKNRLAKRAADEAGVEAIGEWLVGPTALTFVRGDAVIAAKAISDFARQHRILAYKGGLMEGEELDADSFNAIARLPGLDVLHGQLVGVAASPITGLARGLGSMLSGLAVALGEIRERGLVSGEPPAEKGEEKAEEPPTEAEPPAEEAEEKAEEPPAEAEEPPAEDVEEKVEEPPAEAESEVAEAEEQGAEEPEGEKEEPPEEAEGPAAEAESGGKETSETDDPEAKEE